MAGNKQYSSINEEDDLANYLAKQPTPEVQQPEETDGVFSNLANSIKGAWARRSATEGPEVKFPKQDISSYPPPAAPQEPLKLPEFSLDKQPPKKSFAEQYKDAANDNSDIKSAQEGADRANLVTNIFRSLSQIANANAKARGGSDINNSFYDSLINENNKAVADAKASKQDKLKQMLEGNQLEFQGKEQAYKEGAFNEDAALKARKNDPKSVDSHIARQLAKRSGIKIDGKEIDNTATAAQLEPFLKEAVNLRSVELKDAARKSKKYVDIKSVTKNGVETIYGITEDGKPEAILSGDSTSQSVKNAQNKQEADKATSDVQSYGKLYNKYISMYDAASKEGVAGLPATGMFTGPINNLYAERGGSTGPVSDQLRTGLEMDLIDYIQNVSGKAVTDEERKYLRTQFPKIEQQKEAFNNSMQATFNHALKIANKKRRTAGMDEISEEEAAKIFNLKNNPATNTKKVHGNDLQ